MNQSSLAWMAGYLEGEGSFGCFDMVRSNSRTIKITARTTDKDVAIKAGTLIGARVSGPYNPRGLGRKSQWGLGLTGERSARLMRILKPQMSAHRSSQIEDALKKWDTRSGKSARSLKGVDIPNYGVGPEINLAWLAGYLEAEGSFTCSTKKRSLLITFQTTDGDVAQKAAHLLGRQATGPYQRSSRKFKQKPYWAAIVSGHNAAAMMRAVFPWMGVRRRQQISVALDMWYSRENKQRERGLPPICHPDRKHWALGFCKPCYENNVREGIIVPNPNYLNAGVRAYQAALEVTVQR